MRWETASACIILARNNASLQSCRATGKAHTPLCNDSAVTYKLGDGTFKRPRIVHVDRLWATVEEGHFT